MSKFSAYKKRIVRTHYKARRRELGDFADSGRAAARSERLARLRRSVRGLALGCLLALAASAHAQFAERTTPGPLEELRYSWASDGTQRLLGSWGIYEVTLDLVVLPRLTAGHGFIWGFETLLDRGEPLFTSEVFGWELFGYIDVGGLQIRAGWGPIISASTGAVTAPLRLEIGARF